MSRYVSPEGERVRATLRRLFKVAWPSAKVSVRCSEQDGQCQGSISWIDGPSPIDVLVAISAACPGVTAHLYGNYQRSDGQFRELRFVLPLEGET